MMVGRHQPDGTVRDDAVEMVPGQRLAIAQDRVVAGLPEQHLVVRPIGGIGPQLLAELFEPRHAEELEMHEFGSPHEEMDVALDEARQHRPAPGVDHPGRRSFPPFGIGGRTDERDLSIFHRQGLGPWHGIVHCEHAGIGDDEVGCLVHGSLRLPDES